MTETLISNMLGIAPQAVSRAASELATAGLIRYSDGDITVLDRAGVEDRSCECYGVVKKESDRLLPLAADMAAN